ncbi:hypothetical protein AMECASPLE_000144 [Ameca splendens]|uniref:Uncharacterized protein n=1 Tax=Ameca splendens TaxID=208324 RepID=A0ABV1A3Z3_9TELE
MFVKSRPCRTVMTNVPYNWVNAPVPGQRGHSTQLGTWCTPADTGKRRDEVDLAEPVEQAGEFTVEPGRLNGMFSSAGGDHLSACLYVSSSAGVCWRRLFVFGSGACLREFSAARRKTRDNSTLTRSSLSPVTPSSFHHTDYDAGASPPTR